MSKMSQLDATIKEKLTKVIFRKSSDGAIIALFPELPCNENMFECLSYMHIGQHGKASANIEGTKSCRVGEYFGLFKELESIGYNLKVVTRISHEMDQKRIASIRG